MHGNILTDPETAQYDAGLTLTTRVSFTPSSLFDVSAGRTARVATSMTRGGTAPDPGSIMGSLADGAGKELRERGLIGP